MPRVHFYLALFVSLSSAGQQGIDPDSWPTTKTLILYLSRTNNTRALAEIIREEAGGALVALELEDPYPEDYDAIVKQVANENATNYLPALKTALITDAYDTIFLGFPTWGMRLPPPVKSFLATHNLEGMLVIPFNTNGGYGIGSAFRQVREMCEGCRLRRGFSTRGGSERDGVFLAIQGNRAIGVREEVREWLRDLRQQN